MRLTQSYMLPTNQALSAASKTDDLAPFQKRINERKKSWLWFRHLTATLQSSKPIPKAPGLKIVYLVSDVAKFATLLMKR